MEAISANPRARHTIPSSIVSSRCATMEKKKEFVTLGSRQIHLSLSLSRPLSLSPSVCVCACVCVCVCVHTCDTYIHTYVWYIHTYISIYIHIHISKTPCQSLPGPSNQQQGPAQAPSNFWVTSPVVAHWPPAAPITFYIRYKGDTFFFSILIRWPSL